MIPLPADDTYEGFEDLIERTNGWLKDQRDILITNLQSVMVQKTDGEHFHWRRLVKNWGNQNIGGKAVITDEIIGGRTRAAPKVYAYDYFLMNFLTEIRKRTGSKRTIIQRIKERKLNLFGHICIMEDSRLVKEVVFGKMKGKTKRGIPKREWLDDVKERCNKEIYILKRKAQDRDAWKIVVKCALDTHG